MGYVAQFGYRGASNRSMIITRNEGFSGVTGTGGWYMHMSQGVTPFLRVWASQIPPATTIVFATRYPAGERGGGGRGGEDGEARKAGREGKVVPLLREWHRISG